MLIFLTLPLTYGTRSKALRGEHAGDARAVEELKINIPGRQATLRGFWAVFFLSGISRNSRQD